MKIGEAATLSGVSGKMIRHYEAIGLLEPGIRRPNGYRDYEARNVHELRFIRSARDLGFSLEEIRALLDLWRDRTRRSRDVHGLAAAHLANIERRSEELRKIAETLRELMRHCHKDERAECPILEELASPPIRGVRDNRPDRRRTRSEVQRD